VCTCSFASRFFLCFMGMWALAAGENEPSYLAKSVELSRERSALRNLNQDYLVIGGAKRSVKFSQTLYSCGVIRIGDREMKERTLRWYCYEIRCKGPEEAPYVWAVWLDRPVMSFFIVNGDRKSSYLAWIDVTDIYFADISKPRDRVVAFSECISGRRPGIFHVPVGRLVERKHYLRVSDSHSAPNIKVLAIERRDAGKMTVEAFFAPTELKITFEFDGKTWRRP